MKQCDQCNQPIEGEPVLWLWLQFCSEQCRDSEIKFLAALRQAVRSGNFIIRPENFLGWHDDCNCPQCKNQKVIMDWFEGVRKSNVCIE